jgi:hypothetical protein
MAQTDVGLDPHQKEIAKLIRLNAQRHRLHRVFADFCEMAAISLSNAVDRLHRERREARYLQIVAPYSAEEVHRFPMMLAHLVESLQAGFLDSLGTLFMSFEFGDQWKGQFFTPYPVASLMARLTLGDLKADVERDGFVTVGEPASGAGAMVIAVAEAALDCGVNFQEAMHVTAQDIDATAVHMTYVQLALLHVPAIVVHGNTLTLKEWDHWVTPAHVLGRWDVKLQRARRAADQPAKGAEAAAPTPAASSAGAGMAELRAVVVEQRIEKADQLTLF